MTAMIRELYSALKAAGVDEHQASEAAEAVLAIREEDRLRSIEGRIANVEGDIKLLKWMLGFNLALSVAVLWLVIRGAV